MGGKQGQKDASDHFTMKMLALGQLWLVLPPIPTHRDPRMALNGVMRALKRESKAKNKDG